MTQPVRLLLVDENDDFLDGLSERLSGNPLFALLGRAHSGLEALERMAPERPGLVLVDMTLPDMSGLELTRRLKARERPPLVILLAFHDSEALRRLAAAAGADGLLSEPELRERFVPSLERLLASLGRPSGQAGRIGGDGSTDNSSGGSR